MATTNTKLELPAKIEVSVHCKVCNRTLVVEFYEDIHGLLVILAEPCPDCLKAEYELGVEDGQEGTENPQ